MNYLLGVDLGTSGTKTVLFDEDGNVVASKTIEYPLYQEKNGWAEQEPLDWWNAAADTIHAVITESGVDNKDIKGLGISGQMHGLVMLDKDGNVPNMDRAMLADACATCAGAVCGTSTVTTFVESSAGVAEGGRTGLASMATAAMFFIAMFLSPVAQLIPTYACAAALIYVGVLMMSNVRNINWDDPAAAVTGFVTVAFMPLTYNISYGIAFGLISYVFVKIFTGKIKDINVGTWIISILFALMFFLTR